MNQEDSLFLKHFSWVLIGLAVFTVIIIVLAKIIHSTLIITENPGRAAQKLERIQPIAAVYVGSEGLAAAQAAASAAAPATAPSGDGIDGQAIYQQVCSACHATGAAGAPKLEAEAWAERLPKGVDALVHSAINGIGVMPAKGGRSNLSDEEVRATVEWMLGQFDTAAPADNAQTSTSDAMAAPSAMVASATADPAIDGQAIYQTVCFACHGTGAAGAPKLEAAAWTERLPKGVDGLVQSAINGIGVMPAKGGRSDLSDAEVRAIVEWMVSQVQ